MLTRFIAGLGSFNVVLMAVMLGLSVGCEGDGMDLRATPPARQPAPVVPPVDPVPQDVAVNPNALIGTGMRSCSTGSPGGGQQVGEVVIMNVAQQFPPWDPTHCLVLGHNGRWPNLHSPMHHWWDGTQLPDTILRASYFVPGGTCVGFKPYQDVNYVAPYSFLGSWICRATWQGGENWILWSGSWSISSLKTAYISCPNGGCSPPADW